MKLSESHIGEIISGINGSDILDHGVSPEFWDDQTLTRQWLAYESPTPTRWPDLFAWLKTNDPLDDHPALAAEITTSINEWLLDHLHDEKTKEDISTASGLLKLSKAATAKAVDLRVVSISGMKLLQGSL